MTHGMAVYTVISNYRKLLIERVLTKERRARMCWACVFIIIRWKAYINRIYPTVFSKEGIRASTMHRMRNSLVAMHKGTGESIRDRAKNLMLKFLET